MAWLHATPNDKKKSGKEQDTKSRLKRKQEMDLPIKMPPVDHYEHIVNWFLDIGPATAGMTGNVPISYTEIANWLLLTGTEATTFEIESLVKMSKQYCYQSAISEDINCAPPFAESYNEDELMAMRKKADEKMRRLF